MVLGILHELVLSEDQAVVLHLEGSRRHTTLVIS